MLTMAEGRLLDEPLPADRAREVVRERPRGRACASASPANHPRTARTARARARSLASSSSLGELQRARGVVERRPEACRPGESAVDRRLKRRSRRRLAAPPRGAPPSPLSRQLGEEHQRLRAPPADLRLGEQAGRERPGARPFAGGLMRTRRCERSPPTLVRRVGRGQTKRMLGELGRDRRAPRSRARLAAPASRPRRRRPGVSRERHVAGAKERVVDDGRDPPVHAPPRVSEPEVEHRRE